MWLRTYHCTGELQWFKVKSFRSALPLAIVLPSGLKAKLRTPSRCSARVLISLPLLLFQSLIDLSELPLAIVLPSGPKTTLWTCFLCPLRGLSSVKEALESGLTSGPGRGSGSAGDFYWRFCTISDPLRQSLIDLSVLPLTIVLPSELKTTLVTL